MAQNAQPLRILTTHSYPGYQFVASFTYCDKADEHCFRFLILTVLEWICKRTDDEDLKQRLSLPSPINVSDAPASCFQSVKIEAPYRLEIIALPDQGIWSARIIEPDMDHEGRKAVVGRSFITDVGIQIKGKDTPGCEVMLGVRTSVLDPENVTEEVPFAYRPAFVKTLFKNPDIRASQGTRRVKRGLFELASKSDVQELYADLQRDDYYLPSLIFTSAFRFADLEESLRDIDQKLGLSDGLRSVCAQAQEIEGRPYRLGESFLGYCRVFRVPVHLFDEFRQVFPTSAEFSPGDILLVEPPAFGAMVSEFRYKEEQARVMQEDYYDAIKKRMFSYSKKKAYDMPVFFVPEADAVRRELTRERLKQEIQEATLDELVDKENKAEEEKEALERRIREQERAIRKLEARISGHETNQSHRTVQIVIPEDMEEYFQDEIRDLILTILKNRDAMTGKPETRGTELLRRILSQEGNQLSAEGTRLFRDIERIFNGHKNLSEGDFAELRRLGFSIEASKQGDGHTRLHFMTSQRFYSIPCTGSDVRGMKNAFAKFERSESVYKV